MADTWFIDFRIPEDLYGLAGYLGVDPTFLSQITESPSRAEFYLLHRIPKKNPHRQGEFRIVFQPSGEQLATIHKSLLRRFERFVREVEPRYPHDCAFGYIKNRSTKQNAAQHCGSLQILHADIENFFPTITLARITSRFLALGLNSKTANVLARLATIDDQLAVGLNASPLFANLVCLDLDDKLLAIAKAHDCVYTRYADDMTFSGSGTLPSRAAISTVLNEEGFTLSERKFYQTKRGQSHFVTGLSVFDPAPPRAPKRYKQRLRQEIYYSQKYGVKDHIERERKHYSSVPSGVNKIDGSLKYLAGIEPALGAKLRSEWEIILERAAIRPSYLSVHKEAARPVTFFCDEIEIASADGPVLAVGCFAIEEVDQVKQAMEGLLTYYQADPFQVGGKSKLEKQGLHYSDLPEEVRAHFGRILAALPVRGFVAYDLLSNYSNYQEAYVQLLGTVLFDRLGYYDRSDLRIVYDENAKVSGDAVKHKTLLTYARLEGQGSRRPVTAPKITVGNKQADSCLSMTDFMLGVFGAYAVNPDQQGQAAFERLRDQFRLIVSKPSDEFFTRKNPFSSWPAGSARRPQGESANAVPEIEQGKDDLDQIKQGGDLPLESPRLKVFLCHSSADKTAIRDLYERLNTDGFDPWLDEEDLLPGQKWELEIPRAVKDSHIVLVCLSIGFVAKRGYLQKEITLALDVADAQLEDDIFVIPLKLEECEIPERLSRFQGVNYFEERGYERLIKSLRSRAESLEID